MRVLKRSITFVISFIAFFSHNTQRYRRLYQQHRQNEPYCNLHTSFLIHIVLQIIVGACLRVSYCFGHRAPPHQYLHRHSNTEEAALSACATMIFRKNAPSFPAPWSSHPRTPRFTLLRNTHTHTTTSDNRRCAPLRSLIPATVASTLANDKKTRNREPISQLSRHLTSAPTNRKPCTRSLLSVQ